MPDVNSPAFNHIFLIFGKKTKQNTLCDPETDRRSDKASKNLKIPPDASLFPLPVAPELSFSPAGLSFRFQLCLHLFFLLPSNLHFFHFCMPKEIFVNLDLIKSLIKIPRFSISFSFLFIVNRVSDSLKEE